MTESQQGDKHEIARMHPETKASIANAAYLRGVVRRAALATSQHGISKYHGPASTGPVAMFLRDLPALMEQRSYSGKTARQANLKRGSELYAAWELHRKGY